MPPHGDKYGIADLPVGKDKYIRGGHYNAVHETIRRFKKKRGMASAKFLIEKAFNGVIVERKPDDWNEKSDKYGILLLQPGQRRFVEGATPKNFARVLYTARKRHPELAGRKFRSTDVHGGLLVERLQ